MYKCCFDNLRLSNDAAYNRVAAARAVRRFPVILDRLADGSVNVTTVKLLRPVLTRENHLAVLAEARHRSNREVKVIVARLAPQPDVPSAIRKLPAPKPLVVPPVSTAPEAMKAPEPPPIVQPLPVPAHRAVVAPLSPERYCLQVTMGEDAHDDLRYLQDRLRREIPNGDPALIVARALKLLRHEVDRKTFAATSKPRPGRSPKPGSRSIPARVERAVWKRDGGQCAFVAKNGRRCTERSYIEFHHREPYAIGGEATVENIALRCRAQRLRERARVRPLRPVRGPRDARNLCYFPGNSAVPERERG